MSYGIIASLDDEAVVLGAGADYLEPTIVGGIVAQQEDGTWAATAAVREGTPRRAPSFAILVPGAIRLSDPSFPADEVAGYFAIAFAAIARIAEPDARIVLGSGGARRIGPDVDHAAGAARFAQSLVLARDAARAEGLEVVLEPLNRGETDLIHTIGEALAFLDDHGIEGIRVVADLYHIELEGEPLEDVRRFAGRVGHAHVADDGRIPPGQGNGPIGPFLEALRHGGYTGNVTIECRWKDLAAEAAAALDQVRRLDPAA